MTKALSDTYAPKDLVDVDQLVPNIISIEGALYIKIKKALEEYDYYLKKECDIL